MEMSAFPRKRGDVTTCSQYTPKSRRCARDHEFAIGHESRLFRRWPKGRVKHVADCSANNSARRDAGLTDINCFPHIDTGRSGPNALTSSIPSFSRRNQRGSRPSDVARSAPTIIGVINAHRKNPMRAQAKRVKRPQKRARGLGFRSR